MRLHLGVIDVPYSSRQTTGDVAEILEARYGIMEKFVELHQDDVAAAVDEAVRGKLENLLMGGPSGDLLFAEGDLSEVEELFREMLDKEELNGVVPGVPTAASLKGVNHRLRRPYVKRGPRPSFIDTGLYQASMRAWVEED